MGRITVDVNDEWLDATRRQLGTDSKVATVNAALEFFALRYRAGGVVAAFVDVAMDFEGSDHAWGCRNGRDLARLAEDVRGIDVI